MASRGRDKSDRRARTKSGPQNASKTVFICSEGRPWIQDEKGDFKRIDADAAAERALKPKPYDDKNGF